MRFKGLSRNLLNMNSNEFKNFFLTLSNVCRRIPRDVFGTVYGINLGKPEEWEDADRPPSAEELFDAYSRKLHYNTSLNMPFA